MAPNNKSSDGKKPDFCKKINFLQVFNFRLVIE